MSKFKIFLAPQFSDGLSLEVVLLSEEKNYYW